jgi:hypothetical protein
VEDANSEILKRQILAAKKIGASSMGAIGYGPKRNSFSNGIFGMYIAVDSEESALDVFNYYTKKLKVAQRLGQANTAYDRNKQNFIILELF